ncbi:MAG: ABC transporter substrate-binding protein [Actinobacteria bacterium]|nr:ABC transporter substrate-binding protein [Actinomycetota bacterium]MCB9390582.1 ABC transporter substrate-binding protein [Acidimicrobiia bacterium]
MTDRIVLPGQPRQGLTRREIVKRAGGLAGFFMVPGFAASLTACGDKSVSSDSTSGNTSADVDAGGSDDTIRVGVVLPTEGVGAFVGDVIRRSLDISLAEINARGGANGRKISLVYEGAMVEEMIDGTQRAYDKLAGVENIAGILWCTAIGLPQISDSILRDKMPIMSVFQDVSFERGLWPEPGTPRSIYQFLMSVERVVDPIIDYAVTDRGY